MGAQFTAAGATFTNSGAVTGGNGGAGGIASAGATSGTPGAGGAGIVGAGLTIINSGTIAGGFANGGSGAQAAAIIFTGGSNTLQLQPGSSIVGNVVGTGSDRFQLGGAGTASFDTSQIGPTLQYQGFSTFDKIGASTWTLTGTNTTALPWSVQQGTLLVNGGLANSTFTVSGGALGGTGTVGSTQINGGGAFAPGAPGTPGTSITVAGNLAVQSGAIYLVQVSPTAASFANVTGTASLGGTANANFAPGSYLARQYTILVASGGLGGTTFASLTNTNLPAGSVDSLSYSSNSVLLSLTANLGALSNGGLNQNQQAVANGLNNFFNSGGALPPNFVNVFGLTGGSLGNALTQLDGEVATGAERSAFQLMHRVSGSYARSVRRWTARRFGGGSGLGGGTPDWLCARARKQTCRLTSRWLMPSILTKAPPRPVFDQRWTAWGSAYGGANATNRQLHRRVEQCHVGIPMVLPPGWIITSLPIRFSASRLAAAALNWGLANGLGAGRSDVFQTGVYGITRSGPAYLGARVCCCQSLDDDEPRRAWRSVDGQLRWAKLRRPRRGRLSLSP